MAYNNVDDCNIFNSFSGNLLGSLLPKILQPTLVHMLCKQSMLWSLRNIEQPRGNTEIEEKPLASKTNQIDLQKMKQAATLSRFEEEE